MVTNNINTVLDEEWSFHSGVYVPTGNNDLSTGSPTAVDLTLDEGGTGLANLAAINSDKVDLGTILPLKIDVMAALEWFAAVVAGNTVDLYWAESANSNVAAGNPGGPDGEDGLYTGEGDGGKAKYTLVFLSLLSGSIIPAVDMSKGTRRKAYGIRRIRPYALGRAP